MVELPAKTRKAVAEQLSNALTESIDLQHQFKQGHWNVQGCAFIAVHELLGSIADQLGGHIDELAERSVQLGHLPNGLVQSVASASKLPAFPATTRAQADVLKALVKSTGQYAANVRKAIESTSKAGDAGTADLLTAISRWADKSVWQLESHLA